MLACPLQPQLDGGAGPRSAPPHRLRSPLRVPGLPACAYETRVRQSSTPRFEHAQTGA